MQLFKEYFIFCLDIVPAKTHCIARKEDYSYSEGYVCFEYCICWHVQYGDVVIMLKSSSIFCRNCVLLDNVVAFIGRVNTWTLQAIHAL